MVEVTSRRSIRALGLLPPLLLAMSCLAGANVAIPGLAHASPGLQPVLDPPAVAPSRPPSLLQTRPEAPVPLDPGAQPEPCTACRVANATTGSLARAAYRVEARVLEDGAALRLTSADAAVREALWKAAEARASLVEALRSGASVHLCSQCRARSAWLADLRIGARRLPDGVLLVYTSTSDAIVRHIQAAVQQSGAASLRF